MSECSGAQCPSEYPEVVSECEVHGPSSAQRVRVSRAGSLVNAGLDLEPSRVCSTGAEACIFCLQEVGSSDCFK